MTHDSQQPDPKHFRYIMGYYPTGVTVVTALAKSGNPVGFTANSVASVSLEPPLVLVCISKASGSLGVIEESGAFAVNVLDAGSAAVAGRFAKAERGDRFNGVSHTPGAGGLPILDGALAWMECEIYRSFEAGDHMILVGQVTRAHAGEGEPLLFYQGRYGRLAR